VGSGRQYVAWIHRDDWIALVRWLLTVALEGPVNAVAPNPATSAAFARALGRAMRRPAVVPAPAFALRLAFGELADALLLASQRAMPARAMASGFTFRYETIDDALHRILAPAA
jgi:NAD dependent epimerase/dehydratase family enzyme